MIWKRFWSGSPHYAHAYRNVLQRGLFTLNKLSTHRRQKIFSNRSGNYLLFYCITFLTCYVVEKEIDFRPLSFVFCRAQFRQKCIKSRIRRTLHFRKKNSTKFINNISWKFWFPSCVLVNRLLSNHLRYLRD